MQQKRVWVAVGVVQQADGQILICQRPAHLHQGGKWEFPGGKVEAGEGMPAALIRELFEEVGIEATVCRPMLQVSHDYPDKAVLLDVWYVDAFDGHPTGKEGQPVRWVSRDALADYEFPSGNWPILQALLATN